MVGEFDKLPPQSRTFRLTPTADGHVAMITVTTPQWDGLLRAVGRDELVGSPDLDTPQKRGRNSAGLMKEIAAHLATLPSDEVVARRLGERRAVRQGRRRSTSSPTLVEATSPGYLVREVHPELGEMLHPRPAVTFDEDGDDPARARDRASTPPRSSPSSTASLRRQAPGDADRRRLGVARRRPPTAAWPGRRPAPGAVPSAGEARAARLRAFWARRSSPTVGMTPDG